MTQQEDYCNYEKSKGLKDLGFDLEINGMYEKSIHTPNVWILQENNIVNRDWNTCVTIISAPTHAQARKWLREVKGVDVLPDMEFYEDTKVKKYYPNIYINGKLYDGWNIYEGDPPMFDTYEQAESEGITEVIEYLKENKN